MSAPISFARFAELLSDILMSEPELIAPGALLVEDLGVQSVDVIFLVEAIEEEQGASLEGLVLGDVETVAELYQALVAGCGGQVSSDALATETTSS